MGKPRMIILIRHAQSEGNKNREIHQTIPDHRVKLTQEGHRQALEAGIKLRGLLRPDDTIHFFTSPYRRTRETTEGILQSLTSDSPSPSPFPRHTIKVYEEPRLREQDFGNFQPCSAEMERMWLERADYGHFFYRIPNGESAADAYDRVSGFNESLWRGFGENDFASVCVLVTHGLMTRVFLMKWYHWSVEYFEDLRNINHCEFVIMKLNEDNGKYVLQNQLRTWSELRKEKEMELQREREAKGLGPTNPSPLDGPIPIRRKWGGCPEGCNHGLHRKGSLRSSRTHAAEHLRHQHDGQHKSQQSSSTLSALATTTTATTTETQMLTAPEPALGDRSRDTKPMEKASPTPTPQYSFPLVNNNSTPSEQPLRASDAIHSVKITTLGDIPELPTPESLTPLASPGAVQRRPDLFRFHRDTEDHLLHPPRSTYGLLHLVGRDGGGTLSGGDSLAPSEDEHHHHHHQDDDDDDDDDYNDNDNDNEDNEDNNDETPSQPNSRTPTGSHKPRPSQDLDNDGDDEGSGKQTPKTRRTRPHNHNHHRHLPTPGRRNLTKKNTHIDNNLPASEISSEHQNHQPIPPEALDHEHESEHDPTGDDYDALEEARREDQSIQGSVY